MDCAAFDEQFASALSASSYLTAEFPVEARGIISRSCDAPNNVYLETLAKLSVHPVFSSAILTCYESIFPELVARWPTFASRAQIAAGFGRVLPAVPYLCEVAEYFLLSQPAGNSFLTSALNLSRESTRAQFCSLPASSALETLLALHRLLCFRRETFLPLVDARILYHLLHHSHRPVPYLAVRILCIYLGASDVAQERMLETYGVGRCSKRIEGQWEGREVDYWFLM
jgi:midasin